MMWNVCATPSLIAQGLLLTVGYSASCIFPMYISLVLNSSLTTSRPLLYSLPLAQPMTSAPSFTSLSTNWYTIKWMAHLSLWTVMNMVDAGLVSVKTLLTLWPSRFLMMTWRRSFTPQTSILLVTHLVGTYGWTSLMMSPLRLSSPSIVLLPLHLMGRTLQILWWSRVRLTMTPIIFLLIA